MPAPYSRILRRHFHCNGVNNMELKSIVGPITTPDLMAGAHGPTEVVKLWEEASRKLSLTYSEHFRATHRADALSGRPSILERSGLGVFDLPLRPALKTVRLRSHPSPPHVPLPVSPGYTLNLWGTY